MRESLCRRENAFIELSGRRFEMKNKIFVLFAILFVLSGCAVSRTEFSAHMNQVVKESITRKVADYQNNHKELYSYYLPVSVGKYESNTISTILEISGYEVIMNLNVENVLAARYYENPDISVNALLNSELIYATKGSYKDYDGKELNYALYINELENGTSFVLLRTSHFTYLANVDFLDIASIVQQIFSIARTTRINENEIVSYYSRKEVLDYEYQIVEIFNEKVPINGDLSIYLQERNDDFDWTIDELDYIDDGYVPEENTDIEE